VVDPKLAGLSAEDREAAEALIKEGKEGIQVEPEEEDMPLLLKYRLPGLDTIEDEGEKYAVPSLFLLPCTFFTSALLKR
jgi:hypothetical protein